MLKQIANKYGYDSINSSKVYCKFVRVSYCQDAYYVLIVAKCIVNYELLIKHFTASYVLIVAKCIVNIFIASAIAASIFVLIVAKCIVNYNLWEQ